MRWVPTAILTLVTIVLEAQYSVRPMGEPISIPRPDGADICGRTWYDPEIYLLPNGSDLGLLAQATAPNACAIGTNDSIQAATFNAGSGLWSTPALTNGSSNVCPAIKGQYTRCDFNYGLQAGPVASPSVVRLPNANSPTGYRYYMAFVGGNADYINGKIYWAASNDGEEWFVYGRNATEYWTPVVQSNYVRGADAPRSAPACERRSGIGQVNLAYENGLFYLFFLYEHPVQPECVDRETEACASSPFRAWDRALSTVAFRFDYDANHPFGFGPAVRELFLDGAWKPHTGRLTWRYDVDALGAQLPPDRANPVLEAYNGIQAAGFGYGAGDIKYGGGRWMHVYVFEDRTLMQTTPTLDGTARWSDPQTVDTSAVRTAFPHSTTGPAPGLSYGALAGSEERWWLWVPVATERMCGTAERPNAYAGLSIVPAQLCTPDEPC